MKNKRLAALICALALALPLSGCGREVLTGDGTADDRGGADPDDILGEESYYAADNVFSLFYNSSASLNPMTTSDTNNQLIAGLVYENMVEVGSDFEAEPNVVTSWSTPDGIEWRFEVDTSRVFSDGSGVTATDVAYSLRTAINYPRFENRFHGWLAAIYAADEDTVAVTLSSANYQFPKLLTIPVIKYNSANSATPTGSGPYVFSSEGARLVVNTHFADCENLPVDTVYLREYISADDFLTQFEDSSVDFVVNDPTGSTNLGFGTANEVRVFQTSNLVYAAFNRESTFFADGRLQYAMSYAFDRDYMADNLLQGNAVAAASPVNPASSLYNTMFDSRLAYNLENCASVLDNISVIDADADSLREYMIGAVPYEIDIDFLVCAESSAKVALAERFAEDMASLGLTVTVRKPAYSEYVYALSQGDYDMALCEVRLSSDFNLLPIFAEEGFVNYSRRVDDTMVAYIRDYLAAETADRQYYCNLMCNYIADSAAIIPICFEKHQVVTHRGAISGMSINQNNPLRDFAQWTINLD